MFAIFNWLLVVFVWFFIMETKGKSLEEMDQGQFPSIVFPTQYFMNLVSTRESAAMWHNRLGHMSERGMKILHSIKLFPNLKEVDLGFCEDCVYGKQRRVGFLKVVK